MIDRELGEEVNHLTRSMQFLNCADEFERVRACESVADRDRRILMVKLSAFLLYAWGFRYHRGLKGIDRFTAIPFFEAAQAYSDVNDMFESHLAPRVERKLYRKYWKFINEMRRAAIAIGFGRVPRCSADDLEKMIRWCERMGESEFAKSRRGGCYG